jgi:hypothetical protein
MDQEIHSLPPETRAEREHTVQGIDGALLGAAQGGDHRQDRPALRAAPPEDLLEGRQVQPAILVHRNAQQLLRTQAQQRGRLGQ